MKKLLFVLCGFSCVSCNSGIGSDPVAAPITTNIPEGIYFGEITTRSQTFLNGDLQEDSTITEAYTEIVTANGLPLVQPSGIEPVVGLVIESDFGSYQSSIQIRSVNASGNRLVITFSQSAEIDGMTLGGTGSWTYEYVPPDRLDLIDQRTFGSEPSQFGDIFSLTSTGTASVFSE